MSGILHSMMYTSGGGGLSLIQLAEDTVNFNLADELLLRGWEPLTVVNLTILISDGVVVSSSSTAIPAIRIPFNVPAASKILIKNLGTIIGRGGNGGHGGFYDFEGGLPGHAGFPGGAAGKAIQDDSGTFITVDNLGLIAGGGGGGGGGGSSATAGSPGSGGGGGIGVSSGGAPGDNGHGGGSAGAGGTITARGAGGVSRNLGAFGIGGTGGTGGFYAAAGAAGAGGLAHPNNYPGGAGGAGGAAIFGAGVLDIISGAANIFGAIT